MINQKIVDKSYDGSPQTPNESTNSYIFFAILIYLVLVLSFSISALALYVTFKPVSTSLLPDFVNAVGTEDTRVQRRAFLITALMFAVILAAIVLFRPTPPAWMKKLSQMLSSRLDPGRLAGVFQRRFKSASSWYPPSLRRLNRTMPQRWRLGTFLGCLLASLVIFVWGQYKTSILDDNMLVWVKISDPHIYSVLAQGGDILAGHFKPDASEQTSFFYGFGPAAIYALGRLLGAEPTYLYAYQMARWSNFLAVLILFWGLFLPRFSRLGSISTLLIVVAAAFIAVPLLLPNGYSIYFPNLSALRYMPILAFVVAIGFLPPHAGYLSLFLLAIFAALGVVYTTDVGLISLIAYIAYIGLEQRSIPARISRVVAFLAATAILLVLLCAIIQSTLSVDLFFTMKQVLVLSDDNLGGLIARFNLLHFLNITLFIVTASAMVLVSRDRPLDQEERFVAAIAIMGFVWYAYYLHRPGPLYWIYTYLALFNLRYWLSRIRDERTAERRIGTVMGVAVLVLITQQNLRNLRTAFSREHMTAQSAETAPISVFSGIGVSAAFAETMDARVQVLDRLRTPDARVITGFPYAFGAETKIAIQPLDIIFYTNTTERIDAVIASIRQRRPSRLFLEPDATQAFGPEVMRAVVDRIEKGIAGQYTRDESIREWRVWNLNP